MSAAVPDRTPVIAGIGLSDYPKAPDLDTIGHHALAMQRALADSGVAKADIDGYLNAGSVMTDDAVTMAEYLGIRHRFIDGTMTGGSSFEFHVQHAAAAIRDGVCDTVLVTYGSDYLSRLGRTLGTGGFLRQGQAVGGPMQFEAPYGNSLVGAYAMAARRHMHEFGTTSEQLAEIAVGVREYARLNPNAMYRDPLSVDDVINSRLIADPLHKLDCCVISDGGGAVILTTAERARDLQAATGLRPRRGRHPDPLEHQPDAGLHRNGRRHLRSGRPGPGRSDRGRHRYRAVLRLLHHHRPAPARRPRDLRAWARAGPTWPRVTCAEAVTFPSTPTAGGCRPATPACAASSC